MYATGFPALTALVTLAIVTGDASSYPQVTVTNVQVGDRLVLTGQFVEHHTTGASGAYNNIGSLYRLIARRGSSTGIGLGMGQSHGNLR